MSVDSVTGQPGDEARAANPPLSFSELQATRSFLTELTRFHAPTLMWFKHSSRPWFCLTSDEQMRGPSDSTLRHLTTSASCIESLDDVPDYRDRPDVEQMATKFARAALDNLSKWESDGAARVYCRVRTLPSLIRLAPNDVLEKNLDKIVTLVSTAWTRVDPADPRYQGISEAPDRLPSRPSEKEKADVGEWKGYPPNAFHTYWGLKTLDEFASRGLGALPDEITQKRPVAELWARRTLATQAALVPTHAERVDAHQLAWALATELTLSSETPLRASDEMTELYRTALDSFFSDQLPNGAWRLYQPLFHYPQAGNAYCYTFETLAALLRPALGRKNGKVFRELLRPHARSLIKAARFASRTQIPITSEKIIGWCSGHHPHRTAAEGWATASVFSFLQCLRRLVAHWTAERAEAELGVRQPASSASEASEMLLRERGDTWTSPGEWTLSRQVSALFLHPMRLSLTGIDDEALDPDRPLAGDNQARSAILFGPPGTSKTTVVEAIAGAIGWRYVEIHASDFLNEGMDRVPSRADYIFSRLMELDRCVVLFDEIDGLLVRRDPDHADPFGKFLTTSMLPKIAQLWKQRRVLFFVATNDIVGADPAIKRSQRFDAAIFAAPPSWHAKEKLARKKLGRKLPRWLTWERALADLDHGVFETGHELGLLALLRWDQVTEFVDVARQLSGRDRLSKEGISLALDQIAGRIADDWGCEKENLYRTYADFSRHRRRDHNSLRLVQLDGVDNVPPGLDVVTRDGATYARILGALETKVAVQADGSWLLPSPSGDWLDRGLLRFEYLEK